MKREVVTLCGSTRFQPYFEQLNRDLTLEEKIVVSCGVFGSGSDADVFDGLDTIEALALKRVLDSVHADKIDMSDSIYVVNPGGYIGESTWREILYAAMAGKGIYSIEDIPSEEIRERMDDEARTAERFASWQLDSVSHNPYSLSGAEVSFMHKKAQVLDPWLRETQQFEPFAWSRHREPDFRIDPVKHYGRRKFARYVFDTMQALYEYRQIEGHELFLPEHGHGADGYGCDKNREETHE